MFKKIVIVGPSGVGKTTYISKIPREDDQFYIPKRDGYKVCVNIKEVSFGNKKMRKHLANAQGIIVMIDPEIDVEKVQNFMKKFGEEDNVILVMNKIDKYSKEEIDGVWKNFENFTQASISADLIDGFDYQNYLPIISLL